MSRVDAQLVGAAGVRMKDNINAAVTSYRCYLVSGYGVLTLLRVHFLSGPFVVVCTQRQEDFSFITGLDRLSFRGFGEPGLIRFGNAVFLKLFLQGCGRSYGGYLEYKMSGDKSNFFSKVILPIIVMDVVLIVLVIVKLV